MREHKPNLQPLPIRSTPEGRCIREAFRKTLPTFDTDYAAIERRLSMNEWRSTVQVEEVLPEYVVVTVPNWNLTEKVKLPKVGLPKHLRANLSPGQRLYAYINLGAPSAEHLRFSRWEDN